MTGSLERCRARLAEGRRLLVGVAGGSGSGKTTLAQALVHRFGTSTCSFLMQDSFYIDQSARFDGDGGAVNFDHPSSLDFALLAASLAALRDGATVEVPVYDFATHTRRPETVREEPRALIVVDGTLILDALEVKSLFDVTVFVEADEDVRFARRLERDVKERGRTPDGVRQQFVRQVKPMHDQFVEPSKHAAHLRISGTEPLELSVERVLERLAHQLTP